jgi:hypothetical protein
LAEPSKKYNTEQREQHNNRERIRENQQAYIAPAICGQTIITTKELIPPQISEHPPLHSEQNCPQEHDQRKVEGKRKIPTSISLAKIEPTTESKTNEHNRPFLSPTNQTPPTNKSGCSECFCSEKRLGNCKEHQPLHFSTNAHTSTSICLQSSLSQIRDSLRTNQRLDAPKLVDAISLRRGDRTKTRDNESNDGQKKRQCIQGSPKGNN